MTKGWNYNEILREDLRGNAGVGLWKSAGFTAEDLNYNGYRSTATGEDVRVRYGWGWDMFGGKKGGVREI